MVAPANSGPAEPRAPVALPAPTEIYRAGDFVRFRSLSVVSSALAQFIGALGDRAAFPIVAVVETNELFGFSVRYQLVVAGMVIEVNPALVVRAEPIGGAPPAAKVAPTAPKQPSAATPDADPESIFSPPTNPAPSVSDSTDEFLTLEQDPHAAADRAGITWHQTSAIRKTSANGRFEIVATSGAYYIATDHWTGESTGPLANESSALDWCRGRLETNRLRWVREGADGGWVGYGDAGAEWRVFRAVLNSAVFRATDSRLGLGDPMAPIRSSPDFLSLDAAKAWCEVRATCVVEAGGALRYDPAATIIPF
ncbi:hypothetical protein VT84_09150 [Gemmata sp. SH-PL17]|uniref:hypothetical protein n=1 Tax=Gemmata sp. SH-PL17 TaxID=1630693 RepID=UPI00078E64B4|nr:hypothetical protein [Gemmata sp. SH-PL17]AMV24549.1 hypothetical protein VT84_09150 [Gemmata sp. SH-PL17]